MDLPLYPQSDLQCVYLTLFSFASLHSTLMDTPNP
jgi:hypothetical protein